MKDPRTPEGKLRAIVDDLDHKIKVINAEVKKLRTEEELLQAKLELICAQQRCPHMHHYKGLLNGETSVYVCPDCGLVWEVA